MVYSWFVVFIIDVAEMLPDSVNDVLPDYNMLHA